MPAAKSRGHSAHFRFTSSHLQADNLAEPRRAVLADPLSAKLNRFLHRTAEDASCRIFAYDYLVTIRKKLNYPCGIMLDTRGPEIRIKTFEEGTILPVSSIFLTIPRDSKPIPPYMIPQFYQGMVTIPFFGANVNCLRH